MKHVIPIDIGSNCCFCCRGLCKFLCIGDWRSKAYGPRNGQTNVACRPALYFGEMLGEQMWQHRPSDVASSPLPGLLLPLPACQPIRTFTPALRVFNIPTLCLYYMLTLTVWAAHCLTNLSRLIIVTPSLPAWTKDFLGQISFSHYRATFFLFIKLFIISVGFLHWQAVWHDFPQNLLIPLFIL